MSWPPFGLDPKSLIDLYRSWSKSSYSPFFSFNFSGTSIVNDLSGGDHMFVFASDLWQCSRPTVDNKRTVSNDMKMFMLFFGIFNNKASYNYQIPRNSSATAKSGDLASILCKRVLITFFCA